MMSHIFKLKRQDIQEINGLDLLEKNKNRKTD